MGATEFVTSMTGKSLSTAYRAAVKEAVSEYGHDGYNGTISTTSGASQAVYTPMTLEGAKFYANAHIKDAHKWGDALAIPVAEDKDFTFKTFKFSIDIPVDGNKALSEWEVRDIGENAALLRSGPSIHDVKVTPKITIKTVVENAKGRATTAYQVGNSAALYATKAQAIAKAKKSLENGYTTSATVRSVKYYQESNTTDAVVVKRVTTAARATVEYTVARPKGTPTTMGWVFFGLAAC